MIRADTRLTECPMGLGSRSPASRTISRSRMTSTISRNNGHGVALSAAAMRTSSCRGNTSGINFATQTYSPGSSAASQKARYFSPRTKLAK